MNNKLISTIIFTLLAVSACKRPYEPDIIKAGSSLLVVDGVINTAPNATSTFLLSTTRKLSDTVPNTPDLFARVWIESNTGNTYLLQEKGNGVYASIPLTLPANQQYRIRIKRANNTEYISDFVPAKQTPPIDSITWQQKGDVTVYLNSEDPQNNTRYYRWETEATWEYRALYNTPWGKQGNRIILRDSTNQTYRCWKTTTSTDILLSSTVQLSRDRISNFPLAVVRKNSEQIFDKYSIAVKQYGLTQEAYQYWQILKKNTQQLGTIFDPLPSQLKSNIRNVSNTNEPVVGFLSACSISEKRLFIKNEEVIEWPSSFPFAGCDEIEIAKDPVDVFNFNYNPAYSPYYFVTGGGLVVVQNYCVDCTLRGGTNKKPSFW